MGKASQVASGDGGPAETVSDASAGQSVDSGHVAHVLAGDTRRRVVGVVGVDRDDAGPLVLGHDYWSSSVVFEAHSTLDDVVSNFDEPDPQLDGDHSRCLMHNVLEVRADFEFGGQNTGRSVRLHDQQR